MTIDPAILVAAIAALAGLLTLVVRLFVSGAILPRSAVPREDYEAQKAINASLVVAISKLTRGVNRLAATVEAQRRNGGAK